MRKLVILAVVFALAAACAGAPAPTPQIIYVTPAPTPTPQIIYVTPAPTPGPTATPFSGTGVISFGRNYNHNTLAIIGPATTFKTSSTAIAFSASLSQPSGATTLKLILATHSASGTERVVHTWNENYASTDFTLLANRFDLAYWTGRKPDKYVLRYFRGATMLAEGYFTLIK
jgi:hypothetical protein